MYYKQSMQHIKRLIDEVGIKLVIRSNAVGPNTCYYDSNKKLIHLNKKGTTRKTVVQMLIHEYSHRLQDKLDRYSDDDILQKGNEIWNNILHGELKYDQKKHKRYRDQVLKMQYDAVKLAVEVIKGNKFFYQYIGVKQYIRDSNFYMRDIKYQFQTGKIKLFLDSHYERAPFVKDNLMSNKQLCQALTFQQLSYLQAVK